MMLFWAAALAELPPPDYREAVLDAVESQADALIADGALDAALELVSSFREQVTEDGRLAYEEGLVLRLMGRQDEARAALELAVELSPELGYGWYDLGEVLLSSGDLEAARAAFQRASDLTEDHPQGWAGPFRLADLAGRDRDAEAFERWLKEALRRGFSFRVVEADPTWAGFLDTPELADVLRTLATVYGNEQVIEAWEAR